METNFLGYRINPVAGVVYGFKGEPIRKRSRGYVQVSRHGKLCMMAHRLIWESVHGPIPDGLQINHINGIKTDNRIANLELVTPRENSLHAYRAGLSSAEGTKNGRALLNPTAVREIRNSSEGSRVLARRYGVGRTTIRDARSGKNWSNCA